MADSNERPAITAGRNATEGGGLVAVGIFAASWYARAVPAADAVEIAAVASILPWIVNQIIHMIRNRNAAK